MPIITNLVGKGITAVALVAISGLDIVGVCNENELPPLHGLGAGLYFGCYDVYMILRTAKEAASMFQHQQGEGKMPIAVLLLLGFLTAASCVLTWARFVADPRSSAFAVYPKAVIAPILEWLDAVCIGAYAVVSVVAYGQRANLIGFGINGPRAQVAQVLVVQRSAFHTCKRPSLREGS